MRTMYVMTSTVMLGCFTPAIDLGKNLPPSCGGPDDTCNDDTSITVALGTCVANQCQCHSSSTVNSATGRCVSLTEPAYTYCVSGDGQACGALRPDGGFIATHQQTCGTDTGTGTVGCTCEVTSTGELGFRCTGACDPQMQRRCFTTNCGDLTCGGGTMCASDNNCQPATDCQTTYDLTRVVGDDGDGGRSYFPVCGDPRCLPISQSGYVDGNHGTPPSSTCARRPQTTLDACGLHPTCACLLPRLNAFEVWPPTQFNCFWFCSENDAGTVSLLNCSNP